MSKIKIFFLISIACIFLISGASADELENNDQTLETGVGAQTAVEPSASPSAGTYTSNQSVSLSASGSTNIRYTTNGTTPSCDTGTIYVSAITVSSSKTIKAISCYLEGDDSYSSSNVVSFAYTIDKDTGGGGSTGGGGGGGSVSYCTSVEYGPWQACSGSVQTRSVITKLPSGCSLTTSQQIATSRDCVPGDEDDDEGEGDGEGDGDGDEGDGESSAGIDENVNNIINESKVVDSGLLYNLLINSGQERNQEQEQSSKTKYTDKIVGEEEIDEQKKENMNNFIVYGTATTKKLGAGERAGVVNSYKSAFGKLPTSDTDWSDVIKIANGRWPSEINTQSEANAEDAFRKIYLRDPDRDNPHDDAAVVVMAYGLRPANRNLESEKAAINTFKNIYGYHPSSASAWDIVRAIAYSGATR